MDSKLVPTKISNVVSSTSDNGNEVQKILNTFTDLKEYTREIGDELKSTENQSMIEYMKQSENIANLHNCITRCDQTLERMENTLLKFQNNLENVSKEISTLQRKSISLSQELSNRQAIKKQLSQFIEDRAIPEIMFGIMDLPVTDKEFTAQLQHLKEKISLINQSPKSINQTTIEESLEIAKPGLDMQDILEKIRMKAILKIRVFLLEEISKFRKPMANYQLTQNTLLKFKNYYEFLLSNERSIAQEIIKEYLNTMNRIYFLYFKSYYERIMKLEDEEVATKNDLMGIEDTDGQFNKSLKQKATVFSIGTRGSILAEQLESPIIVPQAVHSNKYAFEVLFRSIQYALVDNACREYLFMSDFFKIQREPATELFKKMMAPTLLSLQKNLQTYVSNCYDSIGIFLCFHIVLQYNIICNKRNVPALDEHWACLERILLSRFEHIVKSNISSIRDSGITKFTPDHLGAHYISRRYAEFSGAVVNLSENFPNKIISQLLAELQEEVELFVLRMANTFVERKDQLIFLINNYDIILNIIMERANDKCKEVQTFKSLLVARSGEYAEIILFPHFDELIQYVKECEHFYEAAMIKEIKEMVSKSSDIVKSFSQKWKKSLEKLSREVLISFPNLVTGSSLLKLAFTQLVQYYYRFHKLLTPNVRSQLVNIDLIMMEMKKYKMTY